MIVNLTPHSVVMLDDDGKEITKYPPSGIVARVDEISTPEEVIEVEPGIHVPVATISFGDVALPEPSAPTSYIVSLLTAQAARDAGRATWDLLITAGGEVRDSFGRVIGCRRLAHLKMDSNVLSNSWVGERPLSWREKADQLEEENKRMRPWAMLVSDLDRCEHGRHEGDPCSSCRGLSVGNGHGPIGYGISGDVISVPEGWDAKANPAAWRIEAALTKAEPPRILVPDLMAALEASLAAARAEQDKAKGASPM